jgi:uridine phosphorylase
MRRIADSELILNDRGAVYHLACRPEEVAPTIIVVGDQDRVPMVSKHFDKIEFKNRHREFVTHTGYIGNKKITCISTGIGTDNIDIVINELDALFNIDLETKTIKEQLTSLNIIRMGTSGSLQRDIPIDSYVASTHGIGIDNLLNFYQQKNNEEEKQLVQSFVTQTQMHNQFAHPYIGSAGVSLLKHFTEDFHPGITVTCPGFYGPQGRVLRIGLANPQLIDNLTKFIFGNHRITNFEMETAAIYGLGKILGHHCLSLNAIIANRITKEFTKNGTAIVEQLIKHSIEVIADKIA